jgi:hypothetical protein
VTLEGQRVQHRARGVGRPGQPSSSSSSSSSSLMLGIEGLSKTTGSLRPPPAREARGVLHKTHADLQTREKQTRLRAICAAFDDCLCID